MVGKIRVYVVCYGPDNTPLPFVNSIHVVKDDVPTFMEFIRDTLIGS